MRKLRTGSFHVMILLFFSGMIIPRFAPAQENDWPREIKSGNYEITLYQPQSDSLVGNKLYSRSAVSVKKTDGEPVFGAIWTEATLNVDRDTRQGSLDSVRVLNVKFPGDPSADKIKSFSNVLETEIPKWNITISMDQLVATLNANQKAVRDADKFRNDPPEIIYSKQPSILLLFDGIPTFKQVNGYKLESAVNTPYFVLKDLGTRQYYFLAGDLWFTAGDVEKGKWQNVKAPPAEVAGYVKKLEEQSKDKGEKKDAKAANGKIPVVIVRTKPAELIQSDGEPNFVPIEGTNLLYVKNSEDNIFRLIDDQKIYILISGRWYTAGSMNGPWSYVASDKLPKDFAAIPEGSEKDVVLASVAGTDAAKEAIMDAQIPQTAAVDRKIAKCEVKYDGDPKFEQIKGTMLYRAVNTSSTVILSNKAYYVCDNAVWYVGNSPTGPWTVATEIPKDIQNIPPEDPAYNVKYVYIYDVTPTVVYMGYLPGYMGCYVAGPTIVYGTGYPYPCWYGPYYYPRPMTFGFNMNYNPWTGWSFGFSVGVGMPFGYMSFSFGGPMYHAGWWGPPMYRPPYYAPMSHYYGARPVTYRNTNINVYNNYNKTSRQEAYNNIYKNRDNSGISTSKPARPSQLPANNTPGRQPSTSDRQLGPGTKPATRDQKPGQGAQPATRDQRPGQGAQPATRDRQPGGGQQSVARDRSKMNNVYTDQKGNVYRQNGNSWERNDGKGWNQPSQQPAQNRPSGFDRQQMDRQSMDRQRSQQRDMNRSNFNQSRNMSGGMPRGGGGGGMRGGRR